MNRIIKSFLLLLAIPLLCTYGGRTGAAPAEEAKPAFLIGQLSYQSDGRFPAVIALNRGAVVEAAGGAIITEYSDHSPKGLLSAVERLIEKGCNGIILTPSSETSLPQIAKACEEAKVYWVISMRPVNDPEIRRTIESSAYYVGMVMEDDETAGYEIIKSLALMGKKEVALISIPTLNTAIEARERGIKKAANDYGVKIAATVRNCSSLEDISATVNSFISVYPNLDAILRVASYVNGDYRAVTDMVCSANKQKDIKYACIDFNSDMLEQFDKELIAIAAGGHVPLDSSIATAMLVNAVTGFPISEAGSLTYKINYIILRSGDEMRKFYEISRIDEGAMFQQDEIRAMLLKQYNPELTAGHYQTIVDHYTIERLDNFFESIIK